MKFDIVVIGGGPAGLMAAIQAKRTSKDSSIAIFEKNDRVGKKILASGNGHCNYTNATALPKHYNHPSFVSDIFAQMSPAQTRDWFANLGMMDRVDETGRCYPYNQLASSVLDMLRFECERVGVQIYSALEVNSLQNKDSRWIIRTNGDEEFSAQAIILSTGGKASPQLGTNGQGYELAIQLGHHIREPRPAIVMIEVAKELVKDLSGIRADAAIELRRNNQLIRRELGEVLFKDNAISGICTFILSSFIARESYPETDYELVIDALPELTHEQVIEWLTRRIQSVSKVTIDNVFTGLIHKQIAIKALQFARIDTNSITLKSFERIASALKEIHFPVKSLGPFMHAQTTSGGIHTKEIDRHTLSSRLHPTLFFAGEIIDIDGECGGFSLQWAWSSGYVAGTHAAILVRK